MPNPKTLDSAFILLHNQLCRCNLILTEWKGEAEMMWHIRSEGL